MKASEIIKRLQELVTQHGNMDVYLDVDAFGLAGVSEIGVDTEDTGIIFWTDRGDEESVAAV